MPSWPCQHCERPWRACICSSNANWRGRSADRSAKAAAAPVAGAAAQSWSQNEWGAWSRSGSRSRPRSRPRSQQRAWAASTTEIPGSKEARKVIATLTQTLTATRSGQLAGGEPMAVILEQQIAATEMALFAGQPPRVKAAAALEQVAVATRRLKHLAGLTDAASKKLDAAQAAQKLCEEELRRAEAYHAGFVAEVAAADLALGYTGNLASAPGGYADASWDDYEWCWYTDSWQLRSRAPAHAAAEPPGGSLAGPGPAALSDPYQAAALPARQVAFGVEGLVGDTELADGLLSYLTLVAANAPPQAAARANELARAVLQKPQPLPRPAAPSPHRTPQRSALRGGAEVSPASTVKYPENTAAAPGGPATPSRAAAAPGHASQRVEKLSPAIAKRGRAARGRRSAASPTATIVKRTTLRPSKEERTAKKLAEGDLLSSDSDFLDSLSGGDMSDGDATAVAALAPPPAAPLGFQAPPLAAGEAGAPTR